MGRSESSGSAAPVSLATDATRPGSMLGLGSGRSGVCLAAQPSSSTSAALRNRMMGMQLLAGRDSVERGEHERTDVGSGIVCGNPQSEGEPVAGLIGSDDRVHVAASTGKAGVELVFVIRPHRLDRGLGL